MLTKLRKDKKMSKNKENSAKIVLTAAIPEKNFLQKLAMKNRKVVVTYDFKEIALRHPKMKSEHWHEKILKQALKGDEKEARCVSVKGDFTVLSKLIGATHMAMIVSAQEQKAGERISAFKKIAMDFATFSEERKANKAEKESVKILSDEPIVVAN